ncbi:phospholipase A [Aliidiomarina halalkaliphila]|uniref:Phospholipase A1 n=1 Tax=Aliidiomarina halalkaliphila TaxID=2593535 RepID=A0A552X0J8_9GAMM|nr:phospholipase A [Aliidiomarina halalkaliphila]TRW48409.1 phospholipase A [Aliidiomarina halalkaliphila]
MQGKSGRWLCAFSILCAFSTGAQADQRQVVPDDEFEPIPPAAELINMFWELEPEHKRGLYQIRTYQANYILPYHYSTRMNHQPSSPTRGPTEVNNTYRNEEVKIQLSLRTKLLEDFLLPNADLWVAYSQTSLWQAWNHQDSAPFRSTDHNPEIFYVVPVSRRFDPIPGTLRLQMLRFGLAHESNGQREPESRSWNYWSLSGALEVKGLLVESTYKLRIHEDDDDNPDLVHYRGNLDTRIGGLLGATSFTLTRVSPNLSMNRGSWQLDFTHPVRRSVPDGLRVHLQIFSGYGETLIDYNHRQNRIGLGFVLLNL